MTNESTLTLKSIAPEGTFVSTDHFHGPIMRYRNDEVLIYQDEVTEKDTGFLPLKTADLLASIEDSEHVIIKRPPF